ncbi:hypothetical protein [Bacillus sp. PK3-136]
MGGFYFFGGLVLTFLFGVGLLSLGTYTLWRFFVKAEKIRS